MSLRTLSDPQIVEGRRTKRDNECCVLILQRTEESKPTYASPFRHVSNPFMRQSPFDLNTFQKAPPSKYCSTVVKVSMTEILGVHSDHRNLFKIRSSSLYTILPPDPPCVLTIGITS